MASEVKLPPLGENVQGGDVIDVSAISGTTSPPRVSAAGAGPRDQPNSPGRAATHRPQQMHRPWSSETPPSGR